MEKVNVSIIIPMFNAISTIENTINSVLNQTYSSLECIIIDDGSTDGSVELINDIFGTNDKIRVISKKNGGVSSARNLGILKSKGSMVSFLDADDQYKPKFLEKMIEKMNSKKLDAVFCGHVMIYNEYTIKKKKKKRYNKKINYLKGKIDAHTNSWLISKTFLIDNNINFPIEISLGEDIEFFLKLFNSTKKIGYVKECLTITFRTHSDNQLTNFNIDIIDKQFIHINRLLNKNVIQLNRTDLKVIKDYKLKSMVYYYFNDLLIKGYDSQQIIKKLNSYGLYLKGVSKSNGLRSLKLTLNLIKIKKNSVVKNWFKSQKELHENYDNQRGR